MPRWSCHRVELCRLARITSPQLEHFVVLGIITPMQLASAHSSRKFSLVNVYEGALWGELTAVGVSGRQMQQIAAGFRATLAGVPEDLRASAMFLKYVESVKALATILGQTNDPVHKAWVRETNEIVRRWRRGPTPLDARILQILAGSRPFDRGDGRAARHGGVEVR